MEFEIECEKEVTFHCPEGCFSGPLVIVKPTMEIINGKPEQCARFIFEAEPSPIKNKIVRVGKTLQLSSRPGSPLNKFLQSWLGAEEILRMDGKIKTDSLIGRKADFVIRHIKNPQHKHPYSCIDGIFPHGSINESSVFKHVKEGI